MGVGVAKQPKKNSGKTPEEARGESQEVERVSDPVKLRPTFKERLQRVARDAGVDMGILIENQMAEYINREYRRLLEEDLKRLQNE